jgi:hypothetical protein
MGISLLKALEGQFKKLKIKLPLKHSDHIDRKRSIQNFVMVLAIQYLESDMYRYFAKHYTSQRVADNRKVKPIENYIWRRYNHGKSDRDLARDQRNVYRRQQIRERSSD